MAVGPIVIVDDDPDDQEDADEQGGGVQYPADGRGEGGVRADGRRGRGGRVGGDEIG